MKEIPLIDYNSIRDIREGIKSLESRILELKRGYVMQIPCEVGDHPFETSLRSLTVKRYMKKGLEHSADIYKALVGNVAIRSKTLTSMQLDAFEHNYCASPERISRALMKAMGASKRKDPHFFCNNVTTGLGDISPQARSIVNGLGWDLIRGTGDKYIYLDEQEEKLNRTGSKG